MPDQATRLRALMLRRRQPLKSESGTTHTVLLCGTQYGASVSALTDRLRTCRELGCAVLINGGEQSASELHSLWQTANQVVLVTPPHRAAIMATYAAIKSQAELSARRPVHLLFHLPSVKTSWEDTYARLQQSSQRFLGVETRLLGSIAFDDYGDALHAIAAVMASTNSG